MAIGMDYGPICNICQRIEIFLLILDQNLNFISFFSLIFFQILGVYEWSGTNPMPPEFWILPSFLPMHPG